MKPQAPSRPKRDPSYPPILLEYCGYVFNIEAIPAEGMAPKLAKVDKILFADEDGNYICD